MIEDKLHVMSEITRQYPRFKDGRIDYSDRRVCFVVNCVVVCSQKVLLTKRSEKVGTYPGTINGISGYLDRTDVSVDGQVITELREEINAPLEHLVSLKIGDEVIQYDESINREWHVFPALAVFDRMFTPKVNWENKNAKWYEIQTAKKMRLMPGFYETLELSLSLDKN